MAAITCSYSANANSLICEQIAREFGLSYTEVVPQARFEDLGLTRFDLLEFLDSVETRFAISLPDHAADAVRVGDLEDLLANSFLSQKFANPFRRPARRKRYALGTSRLTI